MTQAEQPKIVMRRRIDMRAEAPPGDWAPERIIQKHNNLCNVLHTFASVVHNPQGDSGP